VTSDNGSKLKNLAGWLPFEVAIDSENAHSRICVVPAQTTLHARTGAEMERSTLARRNNRRNDRARDASSHRSCTKPGSLLAALSTVFLKNKIIADVRSAESDRLVASQ
jgi:hypothetical protein